MGFTSDEGSRTRPERMFARLAELLYAGEEYQQAYQGVCAAARLLVTGCDHASLMVRQGERWTSPVATDEVALMVDRLEREAGTGPCVDAILEESPQFAPDLSDEDAPWPALRRLLLAATPVRGMLGFQVAHQGRKLAALNLFSDRAGGFTERGMNQAAILASFCTVALQASADRQQVSSLREGFASNREIGKAIGLLMAYHKVSDDAAFEILRSTSNELNTKLAVVAEQIVAGHLNQLRP